MDEKDGPVSPWDSGIGYPRSIWPAASVTTISPTCADAPGLSSPEIRTVNMGVPSYSTKVEKEWSCT